MTRRFLLLSGIEDACPAVKLTDWTLSYIHGSALVRESEFDDRVVAETRALLA
jgi:hypothetical protein